MKTIKELEIELKKSKVSLYSMIKNPDFKGHVFKGEKNVTLIDDVGEQLLKTYYAKEKSETINDIIAEELKHSVEETMSIKDSNKANIKADIEIKNNDILKVLQEQLETKDKQINDLLKIVLNQQQLQVAQLLTDNQHIVTSEPNQKKTEKKTFWSKLFK